MGPSCYCDRTGAGGAPALVAKRAVENRYYVRRLLKEKQAQFAALLDAVERELSCPICGFIPVT
jgi:hypothetical protein